MWQNLASNGANGLNRFLAFCFFDFSDVISIGGAHIKPSKPLPNDLQKFLDSAEAAEHGVIYFSLGSILHTSKLPKNLIQTFLGRSNHVQFGIHRTYEWNWNRSFILNCFPSKCRHTQETKAERVVEVRRWIVSSWNAIECFNLQMDATKWCSSPSECDLVHQPRWSI